MNRVALKHRIHLPTFLWVTAALLISSSAYTLTRPKIYEASAHVSRVHLRRLVPELETSASIPDAVFDLVAQRVDVASRQNVQHAQGAYPGSVMKNHAALAAAVNSATALRYDQKSGMLEVRIRHTNREFAASLANVTVDECVAADARLGIDKAMALSIELQNLKQRLASQAAPEASVSRVLKADIATLESQLAEVIEWGSKSARLVDRAHPPGVNDYVSPNYPLLLCLGVLGSLLVGLAAARLRAIR